MVVVFHNEGFTTLIRTIHSVINYSPPNLIHEIVMVDDGSTRDYIIKVGIGDPTLDATFMHDFVFSLLLGFYLGISNFKGTIDDWIRDKGWSDIVKVYHNEKREGLIRARVIGAKHATGSVLVYLDAHCEVEPNWLPPLLTPIAQDYR